MVGDFIDRKHSRNAAQRRPSTICIPPAALAGAYLRVILYQEQSMQIAQVLSGTRWVAPTCFAAPWQEKARGDGTAALDLRRGASEHVPEAQAAHIFDLMEKFAGYGFTVALGRVRVVVVQTGWLKAHGPHRFMAAVLSADMDHTDKVVACCTTAARKSASPSCRRM